MCYLYVVMVIIFVSYDVERKDNNFQAKMAYCHFNNANFDENEHSLLRRITHHTFIQLLLHQMLARPRVTHDFRLDALNGILRIKI